MGRIENHRCAGGVAQDGQRAKIRNERVVAERGAALGHQHVSIAGAGDLGHDVQHVPGRQELTFLDVDDAAGRGRGDEEIGLPAQERRDLQHVHHLSNARALVWLVHIAEHGHAERVSDFGKDRQSRLEPDAAVALRACAVGLVEGGFVDETNPGSPRDLLQCARHLQRMIAALERAGPGDQGERQRIAEPGLTGGDDRVWSGFGCRHRRDHEGPGPAGQRALLVSLASNIRVAPSSVCGATMITPI